VLKADLDHLEVRAVLYGVEHEAAIHGLVTSQLAMFHALTSGQSMGAKNVTEMKTYVTLRSGLIQSGCLETGTSGSSTWGQHQECDQNILASTLLAHTRWHPGTCHPTEHGAT
jgi:hypothetical protein